MSPTERELMLRGEPYNSRDPELLALAHKARALCARFAAVPTTDQAQRLAVLQELLGSVGSEAWIEPPFFCDYGAHITIGDHSFINVNCVLLDSAAIHIGENTLLAPGVQLLTATHPVSAHERIVAPAERQPGRAPYRTSARPITIGNNVWIGANSVVLPGVEIGNNTVIGAGSVVTSSIPSNVLAFGQPCRVQRAL